MGLFSSNLDKTVGLLYNTRVYLAGNIENTEDFLGWREEISKDKITAKSTYKVISSCGHYGSTSCGNCDADLDKLDYKLIPRENGTNQLACPSCEYTFDKKDMIFYF